MPGSFAWGGDLAIGGLGQGRIEVKLDPIEQRFRCPQELVGLCCSADGGGIVGKHACLQLAGPVPESGLLKVRLRLETTFKLRLAEARFIEAAKFRGESAQRADELQLPDNSIRCKIYARPASEIEPRFGFLLHFGKGIAAGEKMRQEMMAGKARIVHIAD